MAFKIDKKQIAQPFFSSVLGFQKYDFPPPYVIKPL
jgi:hypothetical protein